MHRFCRASARAFVAGLGATALLASYGVAAVADDLQVVPGTAGVAGTPTLDLSVGGSAGSVGIELKSKNDGTDPSNGNQCNVDSGHAATFSVNVNGSSFANVTETSLTFTECSSPQLVHVSPVAAGTAVVSFQYLSGGTNSAFDMARATFQVRVSGVSCPGAPAAPTVSLSPSLPASGWYNSTSGAPTASITGAAGTTQQYALDGAAYVTANSVVVSSDGIHSLVARSVIPASGSCAQVVSQTSSATVKVDLTAPTYTVSVPAATGLAGWDTSNVNVTYTCDDSTSGLAASCPETETYADGQSALQATTAIEDNAGNSSANQTRRAIKVDTTKPTVTSNISGPTGLDGWDTSGFSIAYTCGDASAPTASGVVDCPAGESFTEADGPYDPREVVVHDAAGNASSTYTRRAVMVDATKPSIGVVVTPAANGAGWNNTTVTADWTCSDAGGSLLVSCPADESFAIDSITAARTEAVHDGAGNVSEEAIRRLVKVDLSKPQVSLVLRDTDGNEISANGNGWFNQDVVVHFTCSDDAVNGVASGLQASGPYACPADYTISTEGTTAPSAYQVRDNAGNATTGSVPAIKIDKTAPVLSAAVEPTNGNAAGWNNVTVTVDWACTEGGSGLDASTPCPSDETRGDGSDVAARNNLTVMDAAGNMSNAVNVRAIKVDTQDPGITVALTDGTDVIAPNANGWFKQAVTVHFTCAENGTSGLVTDSCPTDYPVSEGDHPGYTAYVADNAGNDGSVSVPEIKVDLTVPTVAVHYYEVGTTTDITPNTNGWFAQNVTVHVACADPVAADVASGVDTTTCPADVTRGEGEFAGSSGTVSDRAGNGTPYSVSALSVDKTRPVVALDCSKLPAVINKGDVVTLPWSASDALSGIDGTSSGSVTLDTSTIGATFSVKVSAGAAKDAAGNTSADSNTCSYAVVYKWTGFFQPIDAAPNNSNGKDSSFIPATATTPGSIYNKVKAGSTVPVKFSLGGDQGMGIIASSYPTSTIVNCTGTAPTDAVEETTPNPSGLKYDAAASQYIYSWKTSSTGWAGTCREFQLKLADGTSHYAFFQFTK